MSGRGSASPGAAKLEPPTLEATYEKEWLDYLAHFQPQTVPTLAANSPAKPVDVPNASEVEAGVVKALQGWLKASDLKGSPAQGAPSPIELESNPQPVSAAQGGSVEKGGLPTQPVASGSGGYSTLVAGNISVNSSDPLGVNYIASHLFGYAPTAHQYAEALAAPPGSFIAIEPAIAPLSAGQGQSSAGLTFFAISPETTEVYEATLLVGSDGSVLLKDETNSLYWPAPLSLSLAKAGVNFSAVSTTPTAPPSTSTTSSPPPDTPWPPIPVPIDESKLGNVTSGVSSPDSGDHSTGIAKTSSGGTASKIQLNTYQGALELSHPQPQQQPSANQQDFEKPSAPNNSGEGESQQIQLADGTTVKTEHYSQLYYWNQAAKPFSTLSQEKTLHFTAQNYAELVSAPAGSQVSVTTSYNQFQPDEKPVSSTQQMIETSLIIEASHPLYGQATLTIGMPDWVGDPLSVDYQSDWGWPGLPYAQTATPPPPSASYPGYGEWGSKDYEAHQWAKHHFKQWKEQLTPQESRACIQYTQEWDYKQINGYLRGETTSYDGSPLEVELAQQCIPQLDSAFRKAPTLDHNLVVYRGERFSFAQRFYQAYDNGLLEAAKTERTPLTYRNFLSTTLAQAGFGYDHFASDGDSSSVRLIIKVPQAAQARSAYLSTVSYESERELLFERGSQLYIDAFHKTSGGQLVVECSYEAPRSDGTGKLNALEYEQHCAAKAGLSLGEYRALREQQRQAKIEALVQARLSRKGSFEAEPAKSGPKAPTATTTKAKSKSLKTKGQGPN